MADANRAFRGAWQQKRAAEPSSLTITHGVKKCKKTKITIADSSFG
jgi:hypothetical protein